MKYKVTLNNRVYEVEVEEGQAMLVDEYALAAPAAPAAAATTVVAPAATPLAGPADAAPVQETVTDNETPLAASPAQTAAVRWLLVLGALITSLYGAFVLAVRNHDAKKLHEVFDRVSGNER